MRRTARPIQAKTPVAPGVPDNLAPTLACQQQARLATSVAFDAGASTVANATPAPLLVSRKKASHLLGDVHNSSLWRWEKAGILKPIRMNQNSQKSAVFYRMSDLLRLVQGN